MTIAPLLLVPQLLFSGMLFKLDGFKEVISNFVLCRWSVEAFGTSTDLNNLPNSFQNMMPGATREIENYFEFTSEHFGFDVSIILLMTFILLLGCYIILRKQLGKK